MQTKVHNHFDLILTDTNGTVLARGHAENLVTDQYYKILNTLMQTVTRPNFAGKYTICPKYITVGTGNTTPTSAGTDLGQRIDIKESVLEDYFYDAENRRYQITRSIVAKPTEWVGATITEVGLYGYSNDSYGGSLTTWAQIKDASGNPIGITKTSDTSLTIKATFYICDPIYDSMEDCPASIYYDEKYRVSAKDTYGYLYTPFTEALTTALKYTDLFASWGQKSNIIYNSFGYGFRGFPEFIEQFGLLGGIDREAIINVDDSNGYNLTHISALGMSYNQYTSDDKRTGVYQHMSFKNTAVPNVILGTGDGVQTKFKMPHTEAFDIETTLGTCHLENSEQLKLRRITDFNTAYQCRLPEHTTSVYTTFRGTNYVPYRDGVFAFDQTIVNNSIMGVYIHKIDAFEELFMEPATIEMPIDHPLVKILDSQSIYSHMYFTEDFQYFIVNKTAETYVAIYDKNTGSIGDLVLSENKRILFTTDLNHYIRKVSSNSSSSSNIYGGEIDKSSSTWSLTNEFTFDATGTTVYPNSIVFPYGHNFVDNIANLGYATNGYGLHNYFRRISIDWEAKTVVNYADIDNYNYHYTEHYKVLIEDTKTNVYYREDNSLVFSIDTAAQCHPNYTTVNRTIVTEKDGFLHIGYLNNTDKSGYQDYKYYCGVLLLQIAEAKTLYKIPLAIISEVANGLGDVFPWHCNIFKYTFQGHNFISVYSFSPWLNSAVEYQDFSNVFLTSSCARVPRTLKGITELAVKEQYLVFDVPPAAGQSVTVSYKLNYLPKTDDWIAKITPGVTFTP